MEAHRALARLLAIGLAVSACRATTRPAAEGAPAPVTTVTPAAASAAGARADTARRRGYTDADVRFMQRMIGHHAQALTMAALVPDRSRRDDVRLLAERITVSQRDEIATMQRWLRARGEAVPEAADHAAHAAPAAPGAHAGHGDPMPGMATAAELEGLAALSGPAFDARFLDLMIRHHEGALAMVAELLAARGAAQDTQVFTIASDVDADQRAEIARMRALRATLPAG